MSFCDRNPNRRISMEIGNLDLALLTGCKLSQNWDAQMRLVTAVMDPQQQGKAQDLFGKMIDLGRFTNTTVVGTVPFDTYIQTALRADLNIFGLQPEPDFDTIRHLVNQTGSTCVMRDLGCKSAVASTEGGADGPSSQLRRGGRCIIRVGRLLNIWIRPSKKRSPNGNVLIQVGPVNARPLSSQAVVVTLVGGGLRERRVPQKWTRDRASVLQVRSEGIVTNFHLPHAGTPKPSAKVLHHSRL